MSESIKVIVRIRPLNGSEKQRGCKTIVSIDQDNNQINLTKPAQADNIKSFAYDAVFSESSQQAHVYSKASYSLVQHVLEGYNGTVFAYGQTGCGKTHSMVGVPESEDLMGIIPRCFGHVLKTISDTAQKQFLLRCSFLQIYNEEIHDLLGDPKAKLQLKESPDRGVFVKDILQKEAKTQDELMQFLAIGNKNRVVGETNMNKESSRSHLLFTLYLESATGEEPDRKYMASRLNLVDLAGSERLSKTGAKGDRMKEAQKINLSLSALGNVISALVEGRSQHIPYRDSKLTRLLQDSLGGNTKTVMLANCSPADYNFEETLSTLRYASRAKMIKNKPVINEDPKDALLKQYAMEIQTLKKQIQNSGIVPQSQDMEEVAIKLKEKEVELLNEKNEKELLKKKIQELESRHIQGKNVKVAPAVVQDMKKISILASQTKKNKTSIKLDQAEVEDEMMKNAGPGAFNALPANKKDESKKIRQMKNRVNQLQREVRDLGHENYLEKECLLQDIRDLTKDNKFLEHVIGMLLQKTEVQEIRNASTYNEDKDDYFVPAFYVKNKELVFPKLGQQQSIDLIRQMQNGRHLMVENEKQNREGSVHRGRETSMKSFDLKKKGSKEFHINGVLRQARGGQPCLSVPSTGLKANYSKVRLDPILKL